MQLCTHAIGLSLIWRLHAGAYVTRILIFFPVSVTNLLPHIMLLSKMRKHILAHAARHTTHALTQACKAHAHSPIIQPRNLTNAHANQRRSHARDAGSRRRLLARDHISVYWKIGAFHLGALSSKALRGKEPSPESFTRRLPRFITVTF